MPTFTPPLGAGEAWSKGSDSPADRLMRYYGSTSVGETVWKDGTGWHQSQYPYQGGNQIRVFDDGELISEETLGGLATALEYYLGGHTYEITEAKATELVAAGFGNYINTEPYTMDWFKSGDEDKFTRWTMTVTDPSATYDLSADSSEHLVARENDGPAEFSSSNRMFWVHNDSGYTADYDATVILDPTNYGVGAIAEQSGLALRAQQSGGINSAITINNNIFFVIPYINVGVWRANIDGTGFLNRQVSITGLGFVEFPHRYDMRLQGNVIRVRGYNPLTMAPPSWSDPTLAMTVNLDTDAGDPGPNPTPVGDGKVGLIAAHLGHSASVNARFRGFRFGPLGSLFDD